MAEAETELCFYAELGNPAGLEQAADFEKHEQWEYRIPPREDGSMRGKIRVRATERDGGILYTETIKSPPGSIGANHGRQENTVKIDKEYFDTWIQAFGTVGCVKTRYVFLAKEVRLNWNGEEIVLPEVKYEIDRLIKPDGSLSKWVKIDVEVDKILEYLQEKHPEVKQFDISVGLSTLPLELKNAFSAETMTDEQKTAVANFWKIFGHPVPTTSSTPAASQEPVATKPTDE